MKILYLDLNNSGISGDMFLAALLGLVPEPNKILEWLKKIKDYLPGVSKLEINLIKSSHSGIQLKKLDIDIKESKNNMNLFPLVLQKNKYTTSTQTFKGANNIIYKIMIKSDTKGIKSIGKVTFIDNEVCPPPVEDEVIKGFFISPFESRIAVVVIGKRLVRYGDIDVVMGCDLNKRFKK